MSTEPQTSSLFTTHHSLCCLFASACCFWLWSIPVKGLGCDWISPLLHLLVHTWVGHVGWHHKYRTSFLEELGLLIRWLSQLYEGTSIFITLCLRQLLPKAWCLPVVHLSHYCEPIISRIHWRKFFDFGTETHLDSRMNSLAFGGQGSKFGVTQGHTDF